MSQAKLEDLRREIRRVRRQRSRRPRHSITLRRAVAEYAGSERARGVSLSTTASTLGVAYTTLCQWLQASRGRFRTVAVRQDPAEPTLRLITAQGHRVEGLSRADLVDVLRALS